MPSEIEPVEKLETFQEIENAVFDRFFRKLSRWFVVLILSVLLPSIPGVFLIGIMQGDVSHLKEDSMEIREDLEGFAESSLQRDTALREEVGKVGGRITSIESQVEKGILPVAEERLNLVEGTQKEIRGTLKSLDRKLDEPPPEIYIRLEEFLKNQQKE